ncbi:MAG: DUF4340 domain-containing protein [Candidatus Delongbacteria bacterium]|jgi:hypothetical protein|nr:DUF4340 domain-containing protein [Candidatus Delongbacteria bacterium]MDY0017594.1 DUF4340 domain-containing protein [Candidatus Delongbacteria bacterium]
MKQKIIYFSILAALALGAFYLIRKPTGNVENIDNVMLRLDTLKIVQVTLKTGANSIVLKKGVENWFVEGKKTYTADRNTINTLLKFAEEVSVSNRISDKPEKHSKFGVDSTGTSIKFRLQDNSEISYLIGSDDQERRHTFYRLPGKNEVYLGTLFPRYRLTADIDSWRDKTVFSADMNTVTKISLMKGKYSAVIEKKNDAWEVTLNGKLQEFDEEKIRKITRKLSMFKAAGFADDADETLLTDKITVFISVGSSTKEIIFAKYGEMDVAFDREKQQCYSVNPDDISLISKMFE